MTKKKSSNKIERKGLQEGIATSCFVWLRDGSTHPKTRGGAEGGRVKDVEILFRRDEEGN